MSTVNMQAYRQASGFIVVYDVTDRSSFEGVARWVNIIRDHGRAGARVVLVGNKIDAAAAQKGARQVTFRDLPSRRHAIPPGQPPPPVCMQVAFHDGVTASQTHSLDAFVELSALRAADNPEATERLRETILNALVEVSECPRLSAHALMNFA